MRMREFYSWLYGNKKDLNECYKPFYNNTLYKLDKMENFLESKKTTKMTRNR